MYVQIAKKMMNYTFASANWLNTVTVNAKNKTDRGMVKSVKPNSST